MAQVTISITKRCVFRDSTQEFSNVYTYGTVGPQVGADDFGILEDLVDELVTIEKTFHSTAVTFVRGRLWSSGGSNEANEMLVDKVLTGTGAAAGNVNMDRERAILAMWPAGKDSRGRTVYLRKWYHSCGSFGTVGFVQDELGIQIALTTTKRDSIATQVDAVTRIGPVEEWGLIADSGRERDGGPPIAHKYLEHHQLGDQWRQG